MLFPVLTVSIEVHKAYPKSYIDMLNTKRIIKLSPNAVSVKYFIYNRFPAMIVTAVESKAKKNEVMNQLTQYADDRSPIVIIPFLKDFSFSFKISVVIKINVSIGTSSR
jgi:hypothetical protein